MNIREKLSSWRKIFLDTAPIIYFVEQNSDYFLRAEPIFTAILSVMGLSAFRIWHKSEMLPDLRWRPGPYHGLAEVLVWMVQAVQQERYGAIAAAPDWRSLRVEGLCG